MALSVKSCVQTLKKKWLKKRFIKWEVKSEMNRYSFKCLRAVSYLCLSAKLNNSFIWTTFIESSILTCTLVWLFKENGTSNLVVFARYLSGRQDKEVNLMPISTTVSSVWEQHSLHHTFRSALSRCSSTENTTPQLSGESRSQHAEERCVCVSVCVCIYIH